MQSEFTRKRVPPLRTVREAQGLSLRHVAERAEMDIGQLSRIERGQSGLSIDALARLARALGLKELARMLEPYRREEVEAIENNGSRKRKPRRVT